jgi:hypothetical protein
MEYRVIFRQKHIQIGIVIFLFIAAFLLVPIAQSNFMAMMPGDLGDARLNNYFLENI